MPFDTAVFLPCGLLGMLGGGTSAGLSVGLPCGIACLADAAVHALGLSGKRGSDCVWPFRTKGAHMRGVARAPASTRTASTTRQSA